MNDYDQFPTVAHPYAITVHKFQGTSWDQCKNLPPISGDFTNNAIAHLSRDIMSGVSHKSLHELLGYKKV